MQIITIVENNRVTGVVYGTVEIPDKEGKAKSAYNKIQQKRRQIQTRIHNNTKHK